MYLLKLKSLNHFKNEMMKAYFVCLYITPKCATNMKYCITIFNFRVCFKVSDFCEESVLRSPIFMKGPKADPSQKSAEYG